MIKYEGQLRSFDFNKRKVRSHHSKDKTKYYCDDILTFDIETTSAWINEYGSIIKYKKGLPGDYWNELKAVSLCYIWQFGVNDTVFYGRELTDFIQVLQDIPKDLNCIIWVHNLSWEFHFLQNILNDMKIFARQPHKPMKMSSGDFPNIEFKCTYMLTRLSLESWGKSIGFQKLSGYLNYNKIRTPLTQLTDKELKYAEYDCLVVYHGILDYLKRYEDQWDIPLTQTGTVRREVKDMLLSDPDYHKHIKKLVPRDPTQYKMLQNVFAGGYTHANRLHAGIVQQGRITHYDYTSKYPTEFFRKYPMTPWAYLGKSFPKIYDPDNNAYIFHLRFTRIESTTFNTYLQAIKCAKERCPYACLDDMKDYYNKACEVCKWARVRYDNGRIISAHKLEIWVTEQDWEIIKQCYKWVDMECLAAYRSRKDYLPKPFLEYVLELYGNKTSLKNVKGFEDIYQQSKQYINSLFGMMVTALMQSDVVFDDHTKGWDIKDLTADQVQAKLKALRNWSPRERRYFLSYSWGCWVTAYSRRSLWDCLLRPGNGLTEADVLYADTDSLFILGVPDFSDYNNDITKMIDTALDHYGIDKELARPKDPDGIPRQLGYFVEEPECIEFITLGAKRYCERRKDSKLYLTVSGVNKGAVYCLKDDIENFAHDFIFDKDHGSVKKSLHTYVYDMPELVWPDGYRSHYKYGINLRPTGYHLKISTDYQKLINYGRINMASISGKFKNHMRGRFRLESE